MRFVAIFVVLVLLAYAGLTASAGFRVARGIDDVKAHNVVARVGTRLMGRDAVEHLAIRKGKVPNWITQSPTFWWALRTYE